MTETNNILTEIEYKRFQRLSTKIRNISNNEMGSSEGKRIMDDISYDLDHVADKIDFELTKHDGV